MIPKGKYKNGDRKPSWRKGKKIAIYMDGKWEHFGDSSMQDYRTHKSEKRRENYNARHAKNMQGNSSRAKAFRAYNKITWQDGGYTQLDVKVANDRNRLQQEFNTNYDKSKQGYKDNSPYKNNKSNDIESPTGKITMDNVSVPLIVKDLDYNEQRILKPNSGVHQFKGNRFRETKLYSFNEYKKGGYLKDKNTYVTKEGKETRRGLWTNVYLKNK